MTKRILLIEPDYKNSYPPLGLMKIATYHKLMGDSVVFVKGCEEKIRDRRWDKIYITSLFTYNLAKTIKTIRFYSRNLWNTEKIVVGGVLASLMPQEIEEKTGVKTHVGCLTERSKKLMKISNKKEFSYLRVKGVGHCIDMLPPDYSIFEDGSYPFSKFLEKSYILYSTKGCIRRCKFCAVRRLEPDFIPYIPIEPRVSYISKLYGEKKDMILLDNNVLASRKFARIIDEIKDCGFKAGAKHNGKIRSVDFNQGIDLRLLKHKALIKLSEICINPLRIAFDNLRYKDKYIKCVEMAVDVGITKLSNFVLYNYNETPSDFYKRLKINIDLNRKHGIKIFSFPMRFVPLDAVDRSYVGVHWTKKMLRGVKCILNVTNGIVMWNREFFLRAYGANSRDFRELIQMPEGYILNRTVNEENGKIGKWIKMYRSMSPIEKREFETVISCNKEMDRVDSKSKKVRKLLTSYSCE